MHPEYIEFLLEIQEAWSTDKVVHIGDLVDWASISYHPKAPSLKNSEQEFQDAFRQVQSLYKAFPEVDWMIGNHDALTERQASDLGLPIQVLKSYADLWGVEGWTAHPRYANILIDNVMYQHGDRGKGGAFPALMNAKVEFRSVVQGHYHAAAGVQYIANQNDLVFGLQTGSGVDHHKEAMDYGKKYAQKPLLGCGIVIDGHTALYEPMHLASRS
jgi:hypothetical protein